MISVFEVRRTHVLCHRVLKSIGKPSNEILEEISRNPIMFEMCFRNYRSNEALAAFDGDEEAITRYLRRLKKENAILCFRVVTDVSRYFARDYVAFRIDHRIDDRLVDAVRAKSDLLAPIEDFLQVRPLQTADPSEDGITHIFMNAYETPGQRRDWKVRFYRWANPESGGSALSDINLYNYPLEGTVNETPAYLSDFPEFLERASAYGTTQKCIPVGHGSHTLARSGAPRISLPLDGLPYHGVIFGPSGSGKTNTGLVVAVGALPHLENVVLLDGSSGVWSKLEPSIPTLPGKSSRLSVTEEDDALQRVDTAIGTAGLCCA